MKSLVVAVVVVIAVVAVWCYMVVCPCGLRCFFNRGAGRLVGLLRPVLFCSRHACVSVMVFLYLRFGLAIDVDMVVFLLESPRSHRSASSSRGSGRPFRGLHCILSWDRRKKNTAAARNKSTRYATGSRVSCRYMSPPHLTRPVHTPLPAILQQPCKN